MNRIQVFLTDEQVQDIKLRAKRENKREAEVIRELLDTGRKASRSTLIVPHCSKFSKSLK